MIVKLNMIPIKANMAFDSDFFLLLELDPFDSTERVERSTAAFDTGVDNDVIFLNENSSF